MKRKFFLFGGIAVILLVAIWMGLRAWVLPTRIAFVNYQVISLGQIAKANDNSFIKISELPVEELERIGSYDMVFINGMGLRITEEHRALIQRAADEGTPILSSAVTNPANNIVSLDSLQADSVMAYLGNGGRRNYRSLLNYVRKEIDGKRVAVHEPEAVVKRSNDLIYHPNIEDPDEEENNFPNVLTSLPKKHQLIHNPATFPLTTSYHFLNVLFFLYVQKKKPDISLETLS